MAAATLANAAMAANKDKEIEEQFFANLLLLGFDRITTEKATGVQISPHMFAGQGNTKGMEVVLHFLLCKISPTDSKTLTTLYPVTSKKQAGEFRAAVGKLITDLQTNGQIPPNTYRTSLLHTCSGGKFYYLLWQLSVHAVKCELSRRGAAVPVLPTLDHSTLPTFDLAAEAIKLRIARESSRFLTKSKQLATEQKEWQTLASGLEADYRQVLSDRAAFEKEIKAFELLAKQNQTSHNTIDPEQLKIAEKLWKSLEDHVISQKENREMIESVVDKRSNQYRIDGMALRPTAAVQAALTPILGDAAVQAMIPAEAQGKVDLTQLLNVWGASMKQFQSQMVAMGHVFADGGENPTAQQRALGQTIAKLANLASIHRQHQTAAQAMKVQLEGRLAEVAKEIQELEPEVDAATQQILAKAAANVQNTSTPMKTAKSKRSLELVPPTPSFGSAAVPKTSSSYQTTTSTPRSSGSSATLVIPELVPSKPFDEDTAVEELSQSIRRGVQERTQRTKRSLLGGQQRTSLRAKPKPSQAPVVTVEQSLDDSLLGEFSLSLEPKRGPLESLRVVAPSPSQPGISLSHLGLSPVSIDNSVLADFETFAPVATVAASQRPASASTHVASASTSEALSTQTKQSAPLSTKRRTAAQPKAGPKATQHKPAPASQQQKKPSVRETKAMASHNRPTQPKPTADFSFADLVLESEAPVGATPIKSTASAVAEIATPGLASDDAKHSYPSPRTPLDPVAQIAAELDQLSDSPIARPSAVPASTLASSLASSLASTLRSQLFHNQESTRPATTQYEEEDDYGFESPRQKKQDPSEVVDDIAAQLDALDSPQQRQPRRSPVDYATMEYIPSTPTAEPQEENFPAAEAEEEVERSVLFDEEPGEEATEAFPTVEEEPVEESPVEEEAAPAEEEEVPTEESLEVSLSASPISRRLPSSSPIQPSETPLFAGPVSRIADFIASPISTSIPRQDPSASLISGSPLMTSNRSDAAELSWSPVNDSICPSPLSSDMSKMNESMAPAPMLGVNLSMLDDTMNSSIPPPSPTIERITKVLNFTVSSPLV